MTTWYEIANASSIASPTVLLYPERIQHNLQRMIELTGDVSRLRPHVKTHKLAPIIAMKRAAGIHKFKVSTIAEAEMTAEAQGEDILLAHQPSGPGIARFIALMQRYPATRWATLVDDPANPIDYGANGGLIRVCRIRSILAEPVIRPILPLVDVVNQDLMDFPLLEFEDLGDLLWDRAFR